MTFLLMILTLLLCVVTLSCNFAVDYSFDSSSVKTEALLLPWLFVSDASWDWSTTISLSTFCPDALWDRALSSLSLCNNWTRAIRREFGGTLMFLLLNYSLSLATVQLTRSSRSYGADLCPCIDKGQYQFYSDAHSPVGKSSASTSRWCISRAWRAISSCAFAN